jgi:hypothetical protein
VIDDDALRAEYAARLGDVRALQRRLEAMLQALDIGDADVASRVKTFDSVREKLRRTNRSSLDDVGDLLGVRVTVPDPASLRRAVELLSAEVGATVVLQRGEAVHFSLGTDLSHAGLRSAGPVGGAEVQVLTRSAAALQAIEHDARYRSPIAPFESRLRAARPGLDMLHEIVDAFERLLANPDVHEKRDVHAFVAEHEFLLAPNPDAVMSEVALGLGTQYRMDFVIRGPNATYQLVELENPRHRITTAAGDFTAEVNHALCQVEDWQEWIEDNLPTVQRRYPEMASPEALVVIGRDDPTSPAQTPRLRRRNINMRGRVQIMTYDTLIAGARTYVRSLARNLGL